MAEVKLLLHPAGDPAFTLSVVSPRLVGLDWFLAALALWSGAAGNPPLPPLAGPNGRPAGTGPTPTARAVPEPSDGSPLVVCNLASRLWLALRAFLRAAPPGFTPIVNNWSQITYSMNKTT